MPISGLGMTFKIALRNLLQHRRRTLFLGAALAGVTALLILLGGLTAGMRSTMLHTATTLSTGHLNVGGFFKVTAGQSAPVVTECEKVLRGREEGAARAALRGPARPRLGQGDLGSGIDAGRDQRHRHADRARVQEGAATSRAATSTTWRSPGPSCCSRSS